MRFNFLIEKIGEAYISEVQQQNIRVDHYQHVRANAPYERVKFSDGLKPEFDKWIKEKLTHIKTCEFKELVNFRDMPTPDQPDEEVKYTVTPL